MFEYRIHMTINLRYSHMQNSCNSKLLYVCLSFADVLHNSELECSRHKLFGIRELYRGNLRLQWRVKYSSTSQKRTVQNAILLSNSDIYTICDIVNGEKPDLYLRDERLDRFGVCTIKAFMGCRDYCQYEYVL